MKTEHTETYRGHAVKVDVSQVRDRVWMWAYAIDGTVFASSAKAVPTAEAAMKRGILAARARVDELEG